MSSLGVCEAGGMRGPADVAVTADPSSAFRFLADLSVLWVHKVTLLVDRLQVSSRGLLAVTHSTREDIGISSTYHLRGISSDSPLLILKI